MEQIKCDLLVVGCGPRGLAIALQAAEKNISCVVVDPNPLASWDSSHILDLLMRSPVTFDLVTRQRKLQKYSLAKFLNIDVPYTEDQRELESCNIFPTRSQFYSYLTEVYRSIRKNVRVIRDSVRLTEPNKAIGGSVEIKCKRSVLAVGSVGAKKQANWINTRVLDKSLDPLSVLASPPQGQRIAVVGSAQCAAEYVEFLSRSNKVYWVRNKSPKVTQYPSPSAEFWKDKSALGPYYRTLVGWPDKLAYLHRVKSWQPSITLDIWHQLAKREFEIVSALTYRDVEDLNVDYFILLTGLSNQWTELPIDFSVLENSYAPLFPKVSRGFRLSEKQVHITGLYATAYDGPRQASVISAAETAAEILEWV